MDIIQNLKQSFKQGDSLIRLIYINAGIYLIYNFIKIIFLLFKIDLDLSYLLLLPADLIQILKSPWTIITYMFLHANFMHILFNMLALFWFGKLFLMSFSEKQLVGLYITGGLFAALFYVLVFNLFPYFDSMVGSTLLMGASGSIMAIIVAAAIQMPNMELRLLLLGNIKLKYIAVVSVLISFFGITSNNAGGEIAHLGGALCGYLFVVSLHKRIDITKWVSRIIDLITDIFSKKKYKYNKNSSKKGFRKMNDAEFNTSKAQRLNEIDKILDKIKTSGYESLTNNEKKTLFEQGKK